MENATGTPVATPQDVQTPNQTTGQTPQTPAQAGDQTKSAAQEAMKKLIKIGDEEVDEEEVKKTYLQRKEHQREANRRFQEGMKAKKEADEYREMMKDRTKLIDALLKAGHKKEDIRAMSEEYLAAQLEEEMLDPKERELRDKTRELETYKEREKRLKEEAEARNLEAMKAKYSEDYSKQFVEALKTTGLPPTKPMVAEMAKYIARSAKIGFEMTATEAAKLVREDVEIYFKNLYGEADPETLAKLLGDQGLQKVRTYDTARIKDPNQHLRTPESQPEGATRTRDVSKRMTEAEWKAYNRK